jgi:hypothetical protein
MGASNKPEPAARRICQRRRFKARLSLLLVFCYVDDGESVLATAPRGRAVEPVSGRVKERGREVKADGKIH